MNYVNAPVQATNALNARYVSADPAPPPNESPSVIRDGITNTETALSGVHDAISELERRLDTVLTPVPPATVNKVDGRVPTPNTSHMHGRVSIFNDGFAAAIDRLRALTQRVEV